MDRILISHDSWIPSSINFKLSVPILNPELILVSKLIDPNTREWKVETLITAFEDVDVENIRRIPLATTPHDEELMWKREGSRDFSLKSSYKLL